MDKGNGLPGLGERLRLMELQTEKNRLEARNVVVESQRNKLIRIIADLTDILLEIASD